MSEETMKKTNKTKKNKAKIKFGAYLVVSILLLVAGIVLEIMQVNDNKRFDKKVTAVVKDVDEKYDSDDDEYKYKANCEYVVRDKTYSYTTSWSSTEYHKGDKIEISINSDNPENVNRHELGTIGGFFIFAAIVVFFMHRAR